jgi:ABC-2 type transport system permease protein
LKRDFWHLLRSSSRGQSMTTSLSDLVRVELTKLIRRPMSWILALILAGILALIYGSLILSILAPNIETIDKDQLRDMILMPDGFTTGAVFLSLFGPILLIILSAASIGSEFSWGTFRTMLFLGATRTRLLISKLIALQLVAVLLLLFGIGIAVAASLFSGLIIDRTGPAEEWMTASFAVDAFLITVRTLLVMGFWVLFAAGLTIVTRSLATGMGISLALSLIGGQIAFLLEQLGDIGTWASRTFPNKGIDAIASLNATDGPVYVASDWLWITANVAGWIVLIGAVSIVAFRRMDILAASN